jgi:hypothetical protein
VVENPADSFFTSDNHRQGAVAPLPKCVFWGFFKSSPPTPKYHLFVGYYLAIFGNYLGSQTN